MSRDKQEIERYEIAEIIAQNFRFNDDKYDASDFEWSAHCVQMAGYRKASDVSEEIFAETHNMLVKVMRAVDDGLTKAILTDNEQAKLVHAGTKETLRCVILALAELKKKYTEEGK